MKKLMVLALFGLGIMFVQPVDVKAEGENPWGGVCCEELDRPCDHPIGLTFADSIWKAGVDTCTLGGSGE